MGYLQFDGGFVDDGYWFEAESEMTPRRDPGALQTSNPGHAATV
jgi:hypothetical protein